MKRAIHISIIAAIAFWLISLSGCRREDEFLAAKPDQSLTIPQNLTDLQALLKNEGVFNRNYPGLGQVSSDDSYLDQSAWQNATFAERNTFIWAKTLYNVGQSINDWNYPYQVVFHANTILYYVDHVGADESSSQFKFVKGSALFFRAVAYYNLLQIFTLPYRQTTASGTPGVPLVLKANLNIQLPRASLSACYAQVIDDLNQAAELLPDLPVVKTDASKAAALALLSRIYLVMGDFPQALVKANASFALFSTLQDFTKLSATRPVFPNFSDEEIFHASMINYASTGVNAQVNPELRALFDSSDDLRPAIFFRVASGKTGFNSQYDRKNNLTYPLTTAELLLTKAECEARKQDINGAMTTLNKLLVTRWKPGKFIPLVAADELDALQKILKERRKELVLTSVRWSDLRRLNQETRFAVTLTRVIGTQTYTLPSNDLRYALPIPDTEIQNNPIPQNER